MQTVAFFNNKGGVGKTTLVYHLAWMLADKGYRVVVADLDPQANLTSMFLGETAVEDLWPEYRNGTLARTIYGAMLPILEGTGDVAIAELKRVSDSIALIPGDLNLSLSEEELNSNWPQCLSRNLRAYRVVTAFNRVIAQAAEATNADIALVDVGPNLGAINRAALIASDHVVIPLAPDLFSLQGLNNLGKRLHEWRSDWQERHKKFPGGATFKLPSGNMQPIGYVVMKHSVRLDKPVKAYEYWMARIPEVYAHSMYFNGPVAGSVSLDPNCLATLKDYRSLMPSAQRHNKPMFHLKSNEGALGNGMTLVEEARKDFSELADEILKRLAAPAATTRRTTALNPRLAQTAKAPPAKSIRQVVLARRGVSS